MSTAVSGSGTFGGVSTNTLLLVGAGLAAALLLRRK
jgi:MYXO-CTERM domain-containing protein